jgi:hypothetical protein
MRKLLLLLLVPSIIFAEDYVFELSNMDLRSVPAMGFFPLGGNAQVEETALSTYFLGGSWDLFNMNYYGTKQRLSLMNLSGYLLGLNYAALDPDSEAKFFNMGYFRAGPHYRFGNLYNNRLALGIQAGYGAILVGKMNEGRTDWLHGIDLSFTFSWTEYQKVEALPLDKRLNNKIGPVGAVVGMVFAALAVGAFQQFANVNDGCPQDDFMCSGDEEMKQVLWLTGGFLSSMVSIGGFGVAISSAMVADEYTPPPPVLDRRSDESDPQQKRERRPKSPKPRPEY